MTITINLPQIIGHRGVRDLAPENTIPSFEESVKYNLQIALSETKQNTLGYHLTRAEEDYSVDQFIREINEGSLN